MRRSGRGSEPAPAQPGAASGLREIKRRLGEQATPSHVNKLWTAVYVLLGLRFQPTVVDNLLEKVIGMEESTTYQAIIAKGRAVGEAEGVKKGVRRSLLHLGKVHFCAAA